MMNTKLLIIFILLNIINVMLSTAKSLITIKGGKVSAAISNAVYYGFYTIVLIYMTCELPLWLKILTVGGCNFIGVLTVKVIEEKATKDKLWRVEATINSNYLEDTVDYLQFHKISCTYMNNAGKYAVLNCYCENKEQSRKVKKILDAVDAKYFVSESKVL